MATSVEDKELSVPNPAQMQGEIKQFMTTKEALVARTMAIEVKDEDSLLIANDFLTSTLIPLRKQIEGKRQEYSTTLRRLASQWDKEFTPAIEAVDGLIGYLKEGILSYTREQEKKRQLLQEELDRKAEEERKAAEARGDVSQIPETIPELVPEVQRTMRTNGGTSTVKKVPYLDITNESLIPRRYLLPNTTKIFGDLKAGIEVPGTKISYRDEVSVRTK